MVEQHPGLDDRHRDPRHRPRRAHRVLQRRRRAAHRLRAPTDVVGSVDDHHAPDRGRRATPRHRHRRGPRHRRARRPRRPVRWTARAARSRSDWQFVRRDGELRTVSVAISRRYDVRRSSRSATSASPTTSPSGVGTRRRRRDRPGGREAARRPARPGRPDEERLHVDGQPRAAHADHEHHRLLRSCCSPTTAGALPDDAPPDRRPHRAQRPPAHGPHRGHAHDVPGRGRRLPLRTRCRSTCASPSQQRHRDRHGRDARCTSIQPRRRTSPSDAVKVSGDADKLERAFANLLEQRREVQPRPATRSCVRVEQVDGQALVSVVDTGVGISLEDQAHLFDRFFRGADAHAHAPSRAPASGSPIASSIVAGHDGTIDVELRARPGQHVRRSGSRCLRRTGRPIQRRPGPTVGRSWCQLPAVRGSPRRARAARSGRTA